MSSVKERRAEASNPHLLPSTMIKWPRKLESRMPAPLLRGLKSAQPLPIFVLGMSHSRAVLDALGREPDPDIGVLLLPQGLKNRLGMVSPSLLSRFKPDVAVSMIGGNAHNILGLIEHPEPFDFEEPSVPTLFEDRRIVPRAQIRATLMLSMTAMLAKIRLLKQYYGKPTMHVASPPPIADEAHIARHLGSFAESAGLEPRFTPAPIRMKLYRMHNAIVKETCEAEGIHFVDAIPAALDADGFLAAPFRKSDPTHANARYGALVLEEIRKFADGHLPARAARRASSKPTPEASS